jgi:hypothetical protein
MRRNLVVVLCALMALAWPEMTQAQRSIGDDTLGFWVIGPDAPTRQWASEWIERALRTSATRPVVPILPWQQVLPRLLDVDAPGSLGDPPPSERQEGPAARSDLYPHYPWDMTQELSVAGMIERLHDEHMGVVVQVVVRKYSRESSLAADSVYEFEALAIAEKGLGALSGQVVTLTSATRFIAHRSLREASRQLGERLAAAWVDLMSAGLVRAR